MITHFRSKILVFFILVCLLIFPFQNTIALSNSSFNRSTTDNTTVLKMSVRIVNLSVQLVEPNTMGFSLVFRTYNPFNSGVILTQDYSCGFSVLISAISEYGGSNPSSLDTCTFNYNNPYSITYQPGYTNQYYISSASYGGYSGKDFPIGYYFFDIYIDRDVNSVSTYNAVYMNFGNNDSRIMYQTANSTVPFSWGPPYGPTAGLPVSEQLAPFEISTPNTSSNTNPAYQYGSIIEILAVFVFLPLVLVVGYVIRKKGYFDSYSAHKLTTSNNKTQISLVSNSIGKTTKFCYSCHFQVSQDDVFCQNCGKKL